MNQKDNFRFWPPIDGPSNLIHVPSLQLIRGAKIHPALRPYLATPIRLLFCCRPPSTPLPTSTCEPRVGGGIAAHICSTCFSWPLAAESDCYPDHTAQLLNVPSPAAVYIALLCSS